MGCVERLVKNRTDNLYLVRGNDTSGRRAWYYFRVIPSKKELFDRQIKSGRIQLAGFGHVLESGFGENPPAEVKKRMRDEYGFEE